MDAAQATEGIRSLVEARQEQENELAHYPIEFSTTESDSDLDAEAPIFYSFYHAQGLAGILKMTNVSVVEFRTIWNKLGLLVSNHWSTGRERKNVFRGMDVFFMTLTALKI